MKSQPGRRMAARRALSLSLALTITASALPVTGTQSALAGPATPPTAASTFPAGDLSLEVMPVGPIGGGEEGPVSAAALNEWQSDFTDSTPTHYYAWCHDGRYQDDWPRDARGIVMVQYPDLPAPVYNPVTIAAHAIHCYETWLHERDSAYLAQFLNHVDWLRDRGMDAEGRYSYTFATNRGPAPWYSAMAQGLAISALTRAYVYTGNASYLDAARKALQPFTKDVSKGGVVTEGGRWLEEYPDSTHVLNGMIFSLWGLWDLKRVTGDPTAASVFNTCTQNLKDNLDLYESNGSVLYEVYPDRYAHPTYYSIHIRQLKTLSTMTGEQIFADVAARWEKSFRAYPPPQFHVRREYFASRGRGATVHGAVKYLYRAYFAEPPRLRITSWPIAKPALRTAQLVGMDFQDGYNATFSFPTGILNADTAYSLSIDTPSSLAGYGCDYPITATGGSRVMLVPPRLEHVRVTNNPASPNGDGWNEYAYVAYDLVGPDALVTLKLYDARGQLRKTVPGRVAGGKQTYQWRGTWWTLVKLADDTGVPLEDGGYTCVLQATNSMGTVSSSSRLFVSRCLTKAPPLGTSPVLSRVWAHPTPFTPNGDGVDDATHFCFSVSQNAWITIKIVDYRGEVRTVVNNARFRAGRYYPLWNGRDTSGRVLPRGNYVYYVLASGGGAQPRTSLASGIVTIK